MSNNLLETTIKFGLLDVTVFHKPAPSLANLGSAILAGIRFNGITYGNAGLGSDLMMSDFKVDRYCKTASEMHVVIGMMEQINPGVFDNTTPAEIHANVSEISYDFDEDFANELRAHDWYYAFSDAHHVFKAGRASEERLSKEAKGSPYKTKMFDEIKRYSNAVVAGKNPTRPLWF